jgi:glycosyltransferase involved in cell wall biosynthesis
MGTGAPLEAGLPLRRRKASRDWRGASQSMRLAHVITGLGTGGAEAMLYKLVLATRPRGLEHAVVSLTDEGAYGPKLREEGVPVASLGMRPGRPSPGALAKLVAQLQTSGADVAQSWMYHADLLAGLACAVVRMPLVWGIHHSDVEPRNAKPLTRLTRAACARLSGMLPDRIVCCAESARRSHERLGYCKSRMRVIPNGFDLDRWRPRPNARALIRKELSLPDGARTVGLVARFHPDKDLPNFLQAAQRVAQVAEDVFFIMVGTGLDDSNRNLIADIDALGLRRRTRLLGRRNDVPAVMPALDVLASSSRAEGFPQVLGEAMLCGTPCVATDCGDTSAIIGQAGRIVPPQDSAALAQGMLELLSLTPQERSALAVTCRARIAARYDVRWVAHQYQAVYSEVLAERAERNVASIRPPAPTRAEANAFGDSKESRGPQLGVVPRKLAVPFSSTMVCPELRKRP